ncbi:uncharacterized protein LOC135165326 isoform X2 [Diachasmimorpha longicaudata]
MNFFQHCCLRNRSEETGGKKFRATLLSIVSQFNLNVASLCLGAACIGLTLGWPETSIPHIIMIKCTDACYVDSRDGISTIHVIVNLGSCLGAIVPACVVDISSRRCNFCISAISSIFFWLIVGIARDTIALMVGAAVGGFSAGLFIVTSTMYVGEVTFPDQRGTVGSLATFFAYLGMVISTSISFFTIHQLVSLFMCFLSVGFLLTIYIWMIESPYYLYESGKTLEAKLALKALRGANHILEVDQEYKSMEKFFDFQATERPRTETTLKLVVTSSWRRIPASITMLLLCISQMVGGYAMNAYTKQFLNNVNPEISKIIVACLDLISVGLCVFLIEKIGRKPLLMFSIGGSSICCLILAIDAILYQANNNHLLYSSEKLVTLSIIIIYYASYSLGVVPILPLLTGEVFSSKMKTISISICISSFYLAAMIIEGIFETITFKKG